MHSTLRGFLSIEKLGQIILIVKKAKGRHIHFLSFNMVHHIYFI